MKTILFLLLSSTCFSQTVLRLNNDNALNLLVEKRGNRMICPVNDANGDLIIGMEVLDDPAFADLRVLILAQTHEVEYAAFPDDEVLRAQKYEEIESNGDTIRVRKDTVEHKGQKIPIKKTGQPQGSTKLNETKGK